MRCPFCCVGAPTRKTCRAEAAARARAVAARERSHLRAFSAPAWCRIATTHPRARAMHAPIPNGQPRKGRPFAAIAPLRAKANGPRRAFSSRSLSSCRAFASGSRCATFASVAAVCMHEYWPELRCVMLCISHAARQRMRGAERRQAELLGPCQPGSTCCRSCSSSHRLRSQTAP